MAKLDPQDVRGPASGRGADGADGTGSDGAAAPHSEAWTTERDPQSETAAAWTSSENASEPPTRSARAQDLLSDLEKAGAFDKPTQEVEYVDGDVQEGDGSETDTGGKPVSPGADADSAQTASISVDQVREGVARQRAADTAATVRPAAAPPSRPAKPEPADGAGQAPRPSQGPGVRSGAGAVTSKAGSPKKGAAAQSQRTSRSKRRAAQRIAQRTVARFASDPAPTTQPVPIVKVLEGTPYQAPVQAKAKSESEARMILDLAVDIGAMVLRAGAGSSDVEVSVIAACTSMGLPNAEVDLTATALTVHYADPEGKQMTVVRVVREVSPHFAKVSSLHRLVSDMVAGKVDYTQARSRLDAIRAQRRPFPQWLVTLAWGVLVACFVTLIGGRLPSAVLGFGLAIFIDWVGRVIGKTGLPAFFLVMAQSAIATLTAMFAHHVGFISSPQYSVAAGIVLLLPTLGLVSAVQDALSNFPLTAAGRIVETGMGFGGIVSGIACAVVIGNTLELKPMEITVQSSGLSVLTTIIAVIAAFLVGACGAIGFYCARRLVIPAALIGLVGFLVYVGASLVGIENILALLIASTIVGLFCRPVASRLGSPAIVLIVPAIFPLLQGLSIFASVYRMIPVPGEDVPLSVGLGALFAAITANSAIAAGAVLGDFLSRPMSRYAKSRRTAKARAKAEEKLEAMRKDAGIKPSTA